MSKLVLEPTGLAQWHRLVSEANMASPMRTVNEEVEAYLVYMLMRFASEKSLDNIIALDFMNMSMETGESRLQTLRDTADRCVLLASWFPGVAEKRMVKATYYTHIACSAYDQVASLIKPEEEQQYYHRLSLCTNNMVVVLGHAKADGKDKMASLIRKAYDEYILSADINTRLH